MGQHFRQDDHRRRLTFSPSPSSRSVSHVFHLNLARHARPLPSHCRPPTLVKLNACHTLQPSQGPSEPSTKPHCRSLYRQAVESLCVRFDCQTMPLLYKEGTDMPVEYRPPPTPTRQQSQHSDIAKSAIMSNASPRQLDGATDSSASPTSDAAVGRRDFAASQSNTSQASSSASQSSAFTNTTRSRSRTEAFGALNDTPASTAPSSPSMCVGLMQALD